MIKKTNWLSVSTIVFTILFFISALIFEIYELGALPGQFYGALIGVVITAIITVLLLKGQTKSEESREIHLKVFDKKQEIYFNFLYKLNTILQQEEIISHHKNRIKNTHQPDINIQDLIFELGYLQMHASPNTFNQLMDLMEEIINENNVLNSEKTYNSADLQEYYKLLSNNIFQIIGLLKDDLYGHTHAPIDIQKANQIILLSFKK